MGKDKANQCQARRPLPSRTTHSSRRLLTLWEGAMKLAPVEFRMSGTALIICCPIWSDDYDAARRFRRQKGQRPPLPRCEKDDLLASL